MTEQPNQELILQIYDTVAHPDGWQSVLDRIAHMLNARGSLFFEVSEGALQVPFHSSWFRSEALQAYLNQFGTTEMVEQKVFLRESLASDTISIIPDSLAYDDVEEFKTREYVKFSLEYGIFHRAGGLLNKDNPDTSRFSIQFSQNRGPITDEECSRLNEYLPHIAKALDLGRPANQLASRRHSMLAAINRLTLGVCILDARGWVALSNEEFKRQMDRYDVFALTPGGELRFQNREDQKQFSALKSAAHNHGKFGARPRKEAIAADSETLLCVEITPLHKSEEMGTTPFEGHILYSRDTSQPIRCNTPAIQHVYHLTEAELALVELIAEGLTNRQIAERRERSVATVNVQVKSILSKTRCASRTQLARLMTSFGCNFLQD